MKTFRQKTILFVFLLLLAGVSRLNAQVIHADDSRSFMQINRPLELQISIASTSFFHCRIELPDYILVHDAGKTSVLPLEPGLDKYLDDLSRFFSSNEKYDSIMTFLRSFMPKEWRSQLLVALTSLVWLILFSAEKRFGRVAGQLSLHPFRALCSGIAVLFFYLVLIVFAVRSIVGLPLAFLAGLWLLWLLVLSPAVTVAAMVQIIAPQARGLARWGLVLFFALGCSAAMLDEHTRLPFLCLALVLTASSWRQQEAETNVQEVNYVHSDQKVSADNDLHASDGSGHGSRLDV
jgi:hypothetical protein